jgi:predicted ATPase/DNA-binding CsgD family transcriptional regulator
MAAPVSLPLAAWHPVSPGPPRPLSSLVGRERETAAVRDLILRDGERLVTLIGPGGVGKTRLALRVVEEIAGRFLDGAVFVPLAAVTDPELVPAAIARELGIHEGGDRPVLASLAGLLRERTLLLVLDNLEQVVQAAPSVAELLASCPRLVVLATSRAALRLSGECEFPVPSLALPDPNPGATEDPADSDAIRLFVLRARSVNHEFALTAENAPIIAAICRRLDGLPLAIELAAARAKVLSPPALLARLEGRLDLLAHGSRDLPARQRTMRDAVAWSYDLLSAEEQALFRRLAIFVGGFSLEAAEAVGGRYAEGVASLGGAAAGRPEGGKGHDESFAHLSPWSEATPLEPKATPLSPLSVATPSVFDGITTLIDHSLVRATGAADGEPRFEMLETISAYGRERLAESGDETPARNAHAAYFLALASAACTEFEGPGRAAARELVAREHDNLRAALTWAVERGDAEVAQRLATQLARFWVVLGHVSEGRTWLDRAVALAGPSTLETRADALCWAAQFASHQNAVDRAETLATEALTLANEGGYERGVAMAMHQRGQAAHRRGDLAAAAADYEDAVARFRRLGEPIWEGVSLRDLGVVAGAQGEHERATAYHEQALVVWRRLDHPWGVPAALRDLADEALCRGDAAAALPLYRESLERWLLLGEKLHVAGSLLGPATVALESGQAERAARLLGASAALHEAIGAMPPADLPGDLGNGPERARAVLGEAAFEVALAAGRAFSIDQAIADALAVAAPTPVAPAAPATTEDNLGLTRREREVLRLLVEGHPNREIADALSISPRTIGKHVEGILAKLGVESRTAAVGYALRHHLV